VYQLVAVAGIIATNPLHCGDEMTDQTTIVSYHRPVLPIVPADILHRFHVAELADTRFACCARLLQSIWRERRELAMGRHRPVNGAPRKLGSRLAPAVARTGVNFLAADIAKCVRREAAYREVGALIEEERLWGNLLSSQALTFNLFARAKLDLDFAARLCRQLVPNLIERVIWVAFEHSPGRGDPQMLGDYTAFDLLIVGVGAASEPVFLAVEVKYSESLRQQPRRQAGRYRELTRAYALHANPESDALFAEPLAQLTAEHLLSAIIKERMGPEARGAFLTIAPADNRDAWHGIERYRQTLAAEPNGVPFISLTLEAAIEAVRGAGDGDLADRLGERYTDFAPVHAVIEDWEPHVA
jgi:hypothetical protein